MLMNNYFLPALGALLLVGCSSTAKVKSAPLPFRVAVIPVQVDPSFRAEQTDENLSETEITLNLDAERLSNLLQESLDQRCFSSSVLLSYPDEDEFTRLTADERDDYWVKEAQEAGADIILRSMLEYDPAVYTATNDRFWPNVLLFLLGGPMTWVMNDRSYYLDAKLQTQVYDLNPFAGASTARLSDANYRILEEDRVLNEVALDFIDRADGSFLSYTASLVVPSGFLAKETAAVKVHLEREVVHRLSQEMVQAIREQQRKLVKADRIAPFYVREIELVGDEIRGHVILASGPAVDSMQSLAVYGADGEFIDERSFHGLGKKSLRGLREEIRYDFNFKVAIPAGADRTALRVEFTDANGTVRSNTLRASAREASFVRKQ